MPRIGLITDSDLNRHILRRILSDAHYDIVVELNTEQLASNFNASSEAIKEYRLDAWLLDMEEDLQRALGILVESCDLPLLVNDEVPPVQEIDAHEYWRRRLLEKLEEVAIAARLDDSELGSGTQSTTHSTRELNHGVAANNVWVLAASCGGPEAVKAFLQHLPSGLPFAMVYGQHIETNFDNLLASAVGKDHSYSIKLVKGEQILQHGEIAVVPVDRQLKFLSRGRVVETRKPWGGAYQPSLDQVISELSRVYRERLGVIIFSGLCNDGEIGCRVAKACGAKVWVQEPESCQSPDMVNAALSTGCVSYQGTPEELAAALVKELTENSEDSMSEQIAQ
jgi:chemosensory pili system protein ChpB (putative protein-glutamate methylesterase)